MGTYKVPRNVKGEGKILFIFSGKSLIYTVLAAVPGLIFYAIFKALKLTTVGIIITLIFALIGFSIGTFKMPSAGAFEITKKNAGENIDEILMRLIKFKIKKKKYYIYSKEEK